MAKSAEEPLKNIIDRLFYEPDLQYRRTCKSIFKRAF